MLDYFVTRKILYTIENHYQSSRENTNATRMKNAIEMQKPKERQLR